MAETPDDIGRVTTFVLIALDLLTSLADIALIFINRSKLRSLKRQYTLTQSYQVSENLRVTTGLVLPLGLCNAVLYIGFLIGVAVLNELQLELPPDIFQGGFEAVGLLTLLQAPLSLLITIFFCTRRKRFRAVADSSELTELYFDQFQRQIDSNSHRAR
ncbi:hypothetical protein AAVH_16838 [Aphelenchoides avenae]|nr:hypothetical protein AAVH_16838 [Aphelenchus avenae]